MRGARPALRQPASAKAKSSPPAIGSRVVRRRPLRDRQLFTVQASAANIDVSANRPVRSGESGRTGGQGRGVLCEGAVVVTVTVILLAELPAVSGFGKTVQVESAGAPVQVKVIAPVSPPSPLEDNVNTAGSPGETVLESDEPLDIVKVKSSPVPLNVTVCGLFPVLSAMIRLPVLVPPAVGLKVTEMLQVAPALTLVPQVLVWEKSPLAVMLEMVKEALPVLVRVTVCAGLLTPTN